MIMLNAIAPHWSITCLTNMRVNTHTGQDAGDEQKSGREGLTSCLSEPLAAAGGFWKSRQCEGSQHKDNRREADDYRSSCSSTETHHDKQPGEIQGRVKVDKHTHTHTPTHPAQEHQIPHKASGQNAFAMLWRHKCQHTALQTLRCVTLLFVRMLPLVVSLVVVRWLFLFMYGHWVKSGLFHRNYHNNILTFCNSLNWPPTVSVAY